VIVPKLPRVARRGMKGPDIYAHKAALSNAGFGKRLVLSPSFGAGLQYEVNAWRRHHGLRANGLIDQEMFGILRDGRRYGPFAAHQLALETSALKPSPDRLLSAASIFAYNVRGSIHYTEGSERMYGVRNHIHPPEIPRYEDCSSFATWLYYTSGLPDPNRRGYDGQGYTGTMIDNGRQVSVNEARLGDLVFYGWGFNGAPKHVAMSLGHGRVISHGSESGPLLLGIRYRSDLRAVRRYF